MPDPATATRPDACVMRGVIPYLGLSGRGSEAADFYTRAFRATVLGRMPHPDKPGEQMHVQVEINGGALMMTDHRAEGAPEEPPLARGHLQLVVADDRALWDRAIRAGCSQVMPYERQLWGDDWRRLEDPFGIKWAILQAESQSEPTADAAGAGASS